METITRKVVNHIAGLARSANRRASGLFVAEGYKVIDELLASEIVTEQLIVEKGLEIPLHWAGSSLPIFEASSADLVKMSSLSTPAGVLAIARRPAYTEPIIAGQSNWVLALDGISDPGNLGTIIRTADWFGIKDILCSAGTADCYSPKVVQSAMGSLFRMHVHYFSIEDFIGLSCNASSFPVVVADAAGTPLEKIKMPSKGLLVIGSESHGVSSGIKDAAALRVAIARQSGSGAESLNAAVACGILLNVLTGT